jgi:hypothetical protein
MDDPEWRNEHEHVKYLLDLGHLYGKKLDAEACHKLCQAGTFLRGTLLKLDASSMLVREIVAWFDVMHSKYVVDGTPVELGKDWPADWMRRASEVLK